MDNYNDILERMIQKYTELSGNEISDESDIMIRLKVLAGEIYSQKINEDFLLKQMFPTTATGRYLDMHAAERGLTRKSAKKTKGKPTCIVAKTIKGKGVSFMENKVEWHGKAPNEEEYKQAMKELED